MRTIYFVMWLTLYSDFMFSLSDNNQADIVEASNSTIIALGLLTIDREGE